MSALSRTATGLLAAWLLGGPLCGAPQEQEEVPPPDILEVKPRIAIGRLGPVEVEGERRIVLAEARANLVGETWNTGPDDELAVLWRPAGKVDWLVAAVSAPEPGGLFHVSGIRFPDSGDYELVAGIFGSGDLAAGRPVGDRLWRARARAASRQLSVRITVLPELTEQRPSLAVLSVGDVPVDSHRTTPVPARGEIVLRAADLPPGARVYLAILAPYSDVCYLHGPARPGVEADRFVLQGISLELPGDPRQGHLELIALASREPLAAGPMSFRSFRRREVRTSPTVEVAVDERLAVSNSRWVPHLAITRIGLHALGEGAPADHPVAVLSGDPVELGQSERIPAGARAWILTRPRGSRLWLAQGPAVLLGARARDDSHGPPEATWVWPSTRFEHPAKAGGPGKAGGRASEPFEVMAVVSTGALPGTWIDSSALASEFIQTISPLVRVSVELAEPLPVPVVSLSSVGGEDADPDAETAVRAVERVEVASREELPPAFHLYVARHPMESSLWSVTEAISRGKSHAVPALSFVNPHAEEGARYQLIAIVTRGLLPAEQLEYEELVRTAVATSEVVTVRYEEAARLGLLSRLRRWWTEGSRSSSGTTDPPVAPSPEGKSSTSSPKGGLHMAWLWPLMLCGLAFLALLAALVVIERRLAIFAPLARGAANRVDRALRHSQEWFTPLPLINPAAFLLGVSLLVLLLWAIVHRYLRLYAVAVAAVTDLPPKESAGLALWLVLLTGLAGVFLEVASDSAIFTIFGEGLGRRELRIAFSVFLYLALLCLMLFQALFYFSFLRQTAGGLVPVLGGIAFFLIAFVEATAFFFITRLTLPPAGALIVRLLRMPFVVAGLIFRFFERFFENLTRREAQEVACASTVKGPS